MPIIKVKDHGKCNEWEKRRRDRLNDAFTKLAQLLPNFDPAKIPAKIDILEKSTEFVKELRLSNSRLLSNEAENDEKCKLIKELQDEVNKLILRVKQLTVLLKKANITIPTGPEIKSLGSKRLKWSGRLQQEDVENSVISSATAELSSTKDTPSSKDLSTPTTTTSSESRATISLAIMPPTVANLPATSSSNPPIIIPLRETNSIKPSSVPTNSTVATTVTTSLLNTAPTISIPSALSSQIGSALSNTVIITSSSPSKSISAEPIFTTTTATPIQLPLQTFILTPCQFTGASTGLSTATHPQILTRIALPTPLVQRPLPLQKIPIKPVLKPVPKVKWRRKRKSKKDKEAEANKITAPTAESSDKTVPSIIEVADKVAEQSTSQSESLSKEISKQTPSSSISTRESQSAEAHASNEPDVEIIFTSQEDNMSKKDNQSSKELESAEHPESNPTLERNDDGLANTKPHPSKDSSSIEQVPLPSESIPVLRIIDSATNSGESTNADNDMTDILRNVVIEEENEQSSSIIEVQTESSTDERTLRKDQVEASPVADNNMDERTHGEANLPKITTESVEACHATQVKRSDSKALELEILVERVMRPPTSLAAQAEPSKVRSVDSKPSTSTELTPCTDSVPHLVTEITKAIQPIVDLPVLPSIVATPVLAEPSTPSSSKQQATISTSKALSMSTLHHDLMDTSESVTTTDKISECIARSIDLIDANDSELMELGDHWEDPSGSPKSPISPTQMFLNIFPLLPRESSATEHTSQQSQPQQSTSIAVSTPSQKTPFIVSNSSRSSFFIDAMLPEDHNNTSLVEEMSIVASSSVTPCLALTPPQYSSGQQISSPFSLSSNFYWTPVSSCSADNPFDYRPTSSTFTHPRSSTSTITTATTNANTSSSATKSLGAFSTFVTTVFSSAVTTSPSTTSNSRKASSAKTGKGSKSAGATKQSSTSESKFHYTPPKSSKATVSTAATTSVTWSMPSQSVATYSTPISTEPTSQTPANQIQFTTSAPSSTCSLLDSLNPMDASFFRPLINALDTHDFRSLDFTGGTALPPPPPPSLSTLIPSVPPAPLYAPQHSTSSSFATPTIGIVSNDQAMPTLQPSLIHHHPPSNIFGGNSQQATTSIGSGLLASESPRKSQSNVRALTGPPSVPTSAASEPVPKSHASTTAPSDKTSRTSGRQKAESSKQKAGKSSRTQPYFISTNSTQSGTGRQEQQASLGSHEAPAYPITSQSNQYTMPTQTQKSAQRNFDFQVQNTSNDNSHVSQSQYAMEVVLGQQPQHSQQSHAPKQNVRNSEKSQKAREEKSKAVSTGSNKTSKAYQSQSHILPSTISSSTSTSSSAPVENYQPPAPVNLQQSRITPSSNQLLPKSVTQNIPKTIPNFEQVHLPSNMSNLNQTFQLYPETFQLFPEFSSGSGSRQVGAHNHQFQYNQDSSNQDHNLYTPQQTTHNQHPYYLPDLQPSYDNFGSSIPQQQSQPLQVAHHHHQPPVHTSGASTSRETHNPNANPNQNQSQIVSKFNYTANTQLSQPTIEPTCPPMQQPQTNPQPITSSHTGHQHRSIAPPENVAYSSNTRASANMQGPSSSHVPQSQVQRQSQDPTRQQTHQQHRGQSHPIITSSGPVPVPKPKQAQQTMLHQPFQQPPQNQNPPPQSQQVHHVHHQHHPPQHTQRQPQQLNIPNQQHQPRSPSRTVNWMTDTTYRTGSSAGNAGLVKHQHRPANTVSTNNPFSVSKLVGNASSSNVQSKGQAGNVDHQQPQTSMQRTNTNIISRTKSTSGTANSAPTSTSNTSTTQNQSNYCAEALIRKNPQTSGGDWHGFGGNPPFQSYPTHHHHSQPGNQNPSNPDHYGQYHYHGSSTSHPTSSAPTHFTHFDYSQPQQFHPTHNQQQQHQQITYHQPSSRQHSSTHPQHVHPSQPSHHHNPMQYPNQPHHHQSHQSSSTSSVSNFNLSTIFPEINDKRNTNSNTQNAGTSPARSGMGSTCNYQHPGFSNNETGNSGRNTHH